MSSTAVLWCIPFLTSVIITTGVATPLRTPQTAWAAGTHILNAGEGPLGAEAEEDKRMAELLGRFAPIIKLSAHEDYFPSTVEYMLPHYSYIETPSGDILPANHTLISPSHLDHFPLAGSGLFISISEHHNPQPLLSGESQYLFGPAGQEGGMQYGEDGRGKIDEPVYGFWVDQGRGIVDLWYWTFYPFNFGKPVGRFGVLGNHVADWEHLRMRTVNGTAVSADFTAHTGGRFGAGTYKWEDIETIGERPVAYAAAGSHGIWPDPGDHVYAELGNVFKLIDSTDDYGPIWDTKDRVVPTRYWSDPENRQRTRHDGDQSWRNYRGLWGNKGEHDCWWHRAVGICQIVDAPPGPNRNFAGPPDCIIAPLSEDYSTYNFFLSTPAIRWAEEHSITMVQVEQTCTRPINNGDDDDDGYDLVNEENLEVWSAKGLTLFRGAEKHVVKMPGCKGVRSAVRAYKISLCLLNGRCLSSSHERRICTHEPGKKGYRFGGAVDLEDLDDWRWSF